MNIYSKWFMYAIFALILSSIYDLGRKYIMDKKSMNDDEVIIYMSLFLGFIALIHIQFTKKTCRLPTQISPGILFYVFLLAMAGYAYNMAYTRSMFLTTEVTLPLIIVSFSIIITYLYSSLLFDDSPDFDWRILLGTVLIVIGLSLITIYFKD
jgi:uncharacterized membrane protein